MISYNDFDKERILKEDEFVQKKKDTDVRSDFERDRARIIHSSAFRRLQGKTQIMSPGYLDFYRTRLTHSLEVAQISKGIAIKHGIDSTIVEAISLAHDIGHPPLGHSGERTLRDLMKDHGLFESNAQNIRILTYLEIKTLKDDKSYGLNLTRAVLDGVIKYKGFLSKENEKGLYKEIKRS
jgi:dGTP triphosphohydrolase